MHRFVWDLHYPPPDSLEHEYPISAIYHDTPRTPLGPPVLPGKYSVKLTVNGISYTQPLTIKMDPRVKVTVADLALQFRLVLGTVRVETREQRQEAPEPVPGPALRHGRAMTETAPHCGPIRQEGRLLPPLLGMRVNLFFAHAALPLPAAEPGPGW